MRQVGGFNGHKAGLYGHKLCRVLIELFRGELLWLVGRFKVLERTCIGKPTRDLLLSSGIGCGG